MAKTFLFDADLNAILASIPDKTRIMRHSAGFARQDDAPFIRKSGGAFVKPNGTPYSNSSILTDISNKRILIGDLIAAAERGNELKMELDGANGRIGIYNTTLEEVLENGNEHLKSDALILFAEKFESEEVKKLGILVEGPLKLSQFVFDKIKARSSNSKRNGHGYSSEELEEVKKQLDHPLAVIRTKTKDGGAAVAVLTKARDYKGNLSLVIIAPDSVRQDNYISSIYGKNNVLQYLSRQEETGNITYISPDIKNELGQLSEADESTLNIILRKQKERQLGKKTTLSAVQQIVNRNRKSGGCEL